MKSSLEMVLIKFFKVVFKNSSNAKILAHLILVKICYKDFGLKIFLKLAKCNFSWH